MRILIEYWDGCPNWQTALERARAATLRVGVDAEVVAVQRDDVASPTVRIDGIDPFGDQAEPPAAQSCRLYETEGGSDHSPSVAQLEAAIRARIA